MENKQVEKFNYNNQIDDEVDLFELFSSLCKQWRWLVGITVAGALLSVVVAFMIPKQYEVTTQISMPLQADIAAINVRGYGTSTRQSLFNQYYQALGSSEAISRFIKEGAWLERFFPDDNGQSSESNMLAAVHENFSIEILAPLKEKGEANDPAPNLIAVTLWGKDEQVAVGFLNDYAVKLNDKLIALIKQDGQKQRDLEVERIQNNIALLKSNAKKIRILTIEKTEEGNQVKLKKLKQSIELLEKKETLDTQTELMELNEMLKLAIALGVSKPKTMSSFTNKGRKVSAAEVNITTNSQDNLVLMGSEYISTKIDNIKSRQNKSLLIKEISVIRKQIEEIKTDVTLAALKARKSDTPYILELPALLNKLVRLQALSFDFSNVQLYRINKKASVDGKAEKPKRALIVSVGTVLSGFVAIFVALIMGAVKRRREWASVN